MKMTESEAGALDPTASLWRETSKKYLWVLFMGGVQMSQSCRGTAKRNFTFYHESPGVPGTHLIDLGRMKG